MAEGVWHWWTLPTGLGVAVKLVQRDGRFVVTDLYLYGERITATDLRQVQPGYAEKLANHPGGGRDWFLGEQRKQGGVEPTLPELRAGFEQAVSILKQLEANAAKSDRPRLERPDRSDPDSFYRLVAQAYREYLTQTGAPAPRIAEEAGVPVATAHRWIREARRRGALPAGEKGRAG